MLRLVGKQYLFSLYKGIELGGGEHLELRFKPLPSLTGGHTLSWGITFFLEYEKRKVSYTAHCNLCPVASFRVDPMDQGGGGIYISIQYINHFTKE